MILTAFPSALDKESSLADPCELSSFTTRSPLVFTFNPITMGTIGVRAQSERALTTIHWLVAFAHSFILPVTAFLLHYSLWSPLLFFLTHEFFPCASSFRSSFSSCIKG